MATQPKRDFPPPQSSPFLTETERTTFCAANELTAKGPATPSASPPMTEEEAVELLRAAIEARHSGPATSSPSPQGQDTTGAKKKTGGEMRNEGEKRADLSLVRHRVELPQEIKVRIVELFAQFYTAASIATQIAIEFELALDIKQIASFDPTKKSSRIGAKLRAMFVAMRKEYVTQSTEMAMAHQAHRLRLIGEVVEKATNSKDYGSALKGLELAAKEMGGVLEGKQTVVHSGAVAHVHGTLEDARQEVAMRLAALVDGGLLLPAPSVVDAPSCSSEPAPPSAP